jgi:acyl-CoA reductase-like NAD-dependent aldehyde dehydrogenase
VNSKQPHDPAMTLGDIMTEPDLQEHQRLINRALAQNAARHLARSAQNAGASVSPLVLVVVAAVVLNIAAGVALLVFLQ